MEPLFIPLGSAFEERKFEAWDLFFKPPLRYLCMAVCMSLTPPRNCYLLLNTATFKVPRYHKDTEFIFMQWTTSSSFSKLGIKEPTSKHSVHTFYLSGVEGQVAHSGVVAQLCPPQLSPRILSSATFYYLFSYSNWLGVGSSGFLVENKIKIIRKLTYMTKLILSWVHILKDNGINLNLWCYTPRSGHLFSHYTFY